MEFGFFHGHSAFKFLQALPPEARLFSYDIDPDSARRAETVFHFDPRLTFIGKSQTAFEPEDLAGRKIGFAFFDAAHELDLNQETFRRILPHLAAEATIAVHDTGLWDRQHFQPVHHEFASAMPGEWKDEQLYAHQPDERAFFDWIVTQHPGFCALHFHTTRTLRHGFSLLQQKRALSA